MKRVGVILRVEEITGVLKHYVRDSLLNKFIDYDIELICIPITNKIEKTKHIINSCDGIILPGGDDVLKRDLEIIDYLYKNDIPTLGICLGMQEMALYNNGALEDLKEKFHYTKEIKAHEVIINKNTMLHKIIKKNRIVVNSIHKSVVVKTDLNVSALSIDNYIEAVEDNSKKFFLGIQWHPERMEVEESRLLFDYFISVL